MGNHERARAVVKPRKEVSARDVFEYLKDKRIRCDCGHRFCIHNFSNTLVVLNNGELICHNCY